MTQATDLLNRLITRAKHEGATDADAISIASTSIGVQVRNGKSEELERSESRIVGLRVFLDKRSAIVSTTDLNADNIDRLAQQALAMAKVLPEDRFAGLAPISNTSNIDQDLIQQLDLEDSYEPSAMEMLEKAQQAESAALAVKGVTNSIGGSCSYGKSEVILVNSHGFLGSYARTSHSISACVLAGDGTAMQRDYDYHTAVHHTDLEDAALIGRRAGEKAVTKLNPSKPKTGVFPVVFDPRVANSILSHLASALNGAVVARGTSFLKDHMGDLIFPEAITIIDQPFIHRGLGSCPFDGEGLIPEAIKFVDQGKISNWVLDARSARQLGLKSNGHATRGSSSPPSPSTTNLFIQPGTITPDALMNDIKEGIYITEMLGSSVNIVTGDYSRGASGFMIRDGKIAEPIMEFTLASNLKEMFAQLSVANDLEFRHATNSPTLRINNMSIAGS